MSKADVESEIKNVYTAVFGLLTTKLCICKRCDGLESIVTSRCHLTAARLSAAVRWWLGLTLVRKILMTG